MPSPLKTVAIVGRPNVGKSALFNRLAGKTISIVHDQAGVTRDRITAQCRRGPAWFEIMDTGGIGASTDDVLTDQVQIEASIALDVADLLMFVVDVVDGITTIDQSLARELRLDQRHGPFDGRVYTHFARIEQGSIGSLHQRRRSAVRIARITRPARDSTNARQAT